VLLLEDEKWKKGIELGEALLDSSEPELRKEYDRLKGYDFPGGSISESSESPKWQFRRIAEKMESAFLERLRNGEFLATGYDTRSLAGAAPTAIASDRWRVLVPNFEHSTASGPGISIVGIRIFKAVKILNSDLRPAEPYRTGMVGRPSIRHLIIPEFERRALVGEAFESLSEEARELNHWASELHPEAPTPSPRVIENHIRVVHHRHFRAKATK
jgi:hypothetical protein